MKVLAIAAGTKLNGKTKISINTSRQIQSLKESGIDIQPSYLYSRISPKKIIKSIQTLKSEISKFQPDCIHAFYGSMVSFIATKAAGKRPLVVSYCGDDLLGTPNDGLSWRIREKLTRTLSLSSGRKASHIITKSNNLKTALPKTLHQKVSIIPNGVDTEFFQSKTKRYCRQQLGWNSAPVIFFNASSGGNSNVKNIRLANETINLLKKKSPDARLEVVSNSPPEEIMLKINASDCILVTSLHEGSPNIVKEAMACNRPIVSVPCGDVRERILNANKGGVYPYDPVRLSEAIFSVLNNPIPFNGREEVFRQGLDKAQIALKIKKVYQEVI